MTRILPRRPRQRSSTATPLPTRHRPVWQRLVAAATTTNHSSSKTLLRLWIAVSLYSLWRQERLLSLLPEDSGSSSNLLLFPGKQQRTTYCDDERRFSLRREIVDTDSGGEGYLLPRFSEGDGANRGVLEAIYSHNMNATNNSRRSLLHFVREQALSIYPNLHRLLHPDRIIEGMTPRVFFNNVAMVKMPVAEATEEEEHLVLGFRVAVDYPEQRISQSNLMFCTVTSSSSFSSTKSTAIHHVVCQDSGITADYISPTCLPQHWLAPQDEGPYNRNCFIGPEDARLFVVEQDETNSTSTTVLHATLGMRGCHPGTRWDYHSPVFSTYLASWRWRETATTTTGGDKKRRQWTLDTLKVLDLRNADHSSMGGEYPSIVKSTIFIPPPLHNAAVSFATDEKVENKEEEDVEREDQDDKASTNLPPMHFCVGWTAGMKDTVAYQLVPQVDDSPMDVLHGSFFRFDFLRPIKSVYQESLLRMVPVQANVTVKDVDTVHYRGSTNFIRVPTGTTASTATGSTANAGRRNNSSTGLLLSVGHRMVEDVASSHFNVTYRHFWILMCGRPPYAVLSRSDDFMFPHVEAGVSYTTGLVREGPYLYLTWQQDDVHPYVSRYTSDEVWTMLTKTTTASAAINSTSRVPRNVLRRYRREPSAIADQYCGASVE